MRTTISLLWASLILMGMPVSAVLAADADFAGQWMNQDPGAWGRALRGPARD